VRTREPERWRNETAAMLDFSISVAGGHVHIVAERFAVATQLDGRRRAPQPWDQGALRADALPCYSKRSTTQGSGAGRNGGMGVPAAIREFSRFDESTSARDRRKPSRSA
jgi:hypothetical protein